MFASKTVFIVGAGASEEVGLPIGRDLTSKISGLLDFYLDLGQLKSGDHQIYETLSRIVREQADNWQGNRLVSSARHLGEAMQLAPSIDTFLESFSHDPERVLLGKLGIAKAILLAEHSSKLGPGREERQAFSIKSVADTWYVSLAQQLFSGVPANQVELAFENVSFIVFNYDRCIQVFLMRALQLYFELQNGGAEEIVSNVKIIHPYGNLGEVFSRSRDRVSFGDFDVSLMDVSQRIDTFSETVRDTATLEAIRLTVENAETLVFLGFGFHQQNMDVLTSPSPLARTRRRTARVLATTKGLSKSDTGIVRSMIANLVWHQPPSGYIEQSIHTFDGKCSAFFGEYWRSLTASVPPVD